MIKLVNQRSKRQVEIDALVKRLDNMSNKEWEAEHKKNVETWIKNALTKTIPMNKKD